MTGPINPKNIENIQGRKIEKESNLSPSAKKMLEGFFRTEEFDAFEAHVLDRMNGLMRGEGNEVDKKLLLKDIDVQLNDVERFGEAKGYAHNYFQKLRKIIEDIDVESE